MSEVEMTKSDIFTKVDKRCQNKVPLVFGTVEYGLEVLCESSFIILLIFHRNFEKHLPYLTKISRSKLTKIRLGDKKFVRQIFVR